jgi:predicted alpha/beta-hydrolase family hydrolase
VNIPGVFSTTFEPAGDPVGTALLVPGRGYPPQAPLLFFTGIALLQHGWRVEHHWWDPPAHESDERTAAWVRGEVDGALPADRRTLLVGKSLGTWAAPLAAERQLPAIWLTPILGVPVVAEAIATNPAPQLLVGGTADELEIPDADHVLMRPADVVAGAAAHVDVARAVDGWLRRVVID